MTDIIAFPGRRVPQPISQWHRWTAVITYRTDAGPVEKTVDFDELGEVIERGPSFYTVQEVEVRLWSPSDLTVEQAAAT